MWSDGSQVSFELWGQGKETCAHINFGPDVIWNDLECPKKTFLLHVQLALLVVRNLKEKDMSDTTY